MLRYCKKPSTTEPPRHEDGDLAEGASPKTQHGSIAGVATAATLTFFPSWTTIALMVSLIFGGCCANVGPLITFAQFILTSLFTSPSFLSISSGPRSFFLNERVIPLRSWLVYTAFFVTVNLLNNWAFAYKISVPLHIILRSGGPVASMAVGYLFNTKRYSQGQILAVAMLTVGVVAAALSDARGKDQSISVNYRQDDLTMASTLIGFTLLVLAMLLSAFQGIFADRLYESYGRDHWKEALFYSHTLSLPLFIPTYSHLLSQWRALFSSPSLLSEVSIIAAKNMSFFSNPAEPLSTTVLASSNEVSVDSFFTPIIYIANRLVAGVGIREPLRFILASIPIRVFYLSMNAMTQYLCIRGVHLLSAKTSSLTVTIVLNVRKLISLLLSIYLFGNSLAPGVLMGAFCVFFGGALYGLEGARLKKANIKRD
ncbi:UAA transporter [Aspergillus avenaceus]|uniref:UAA transporter n=1 Tax=Aspergillus avenaceus TaxID=36643 RepID=A0A5N6THI0_ASPAV|nr:UAA transporter [Aspergillus avenaceus]